MCGILAVIDFRGQPVRAADVIRLRDTMVHRGPDDDGLFIEGPVALAHRRLSIIDLSSSGHQPMTNEDGSLQVVFNGEIYNYVELREELRAKGHVFHSTSDTEVILHQYEEDGDRCVEKLRGMFAFALWDSKRRRLLAARDRLGIKPLYYFADASKLILASEIKAITADPDVPRRPDVQGVADYLYAGRPLAGKTMFAGIAEVEPGCLLTSEQSAGTLQLRPYWDLRYDYNSSRSAQATSDELFSIIDDAVKVHCRSDAPVGCHLSGGMDSSSVVGFAARHRDHLKTFSIKFSDEAHIDETGLAKAVARHVGAEYLEFSPTAMDLADQLPFFIWHLDMPLVSDGGFGYFSVSEFARRHVKVSLTGHGGDEVFAGYPAQFQTTYGRTDMFQLYVDRDRAAGTRSSLLRRTLGRVYRSLTGTGTRSLVDTWISLHCSHLPQHNPSVDPSFVAQLGGYSPRDQYVDPFVTAPTDRTLDKCLYHDLRLYLPTLLHLEDRLSMAVSIESRVPLLDQRIVEFLATVPPEQKVEGLQPKYLLRQAASRLLPSEVWQNRVKRAFPVPGSFYRQQTLTDLVKDVLLSKESLGRGVFSPEALKRAAAMPWQVSVIWPFLNLELWFRLCIDRDPYWMGKTEERRVAVTAR